MTLIVVDTETTGLDPSDGARLVEVAAVTLEHDGSTGTFDKMCDPGIPIPPEISAIHHITDDMVRGRPGPEEILADMVQIVNTRWVRDQPIVWVAHNAPFDKLFLAHARPDVFGVDARWICTWRCARHLWLDAPGYSNQTLRYWLRLSLELPEDLAPHRALYDTLVTHAILHQLLARADVEELLRLTTTPVLEKKVGFGKHFGQEWRHVPASYLQWIMKQSDMDADVRHTANYWIHAQRTLL